MTFPQGAFSTSMPRIYPISECLTVDEALPDLKIRTERPRTARAHYGNTAIVIRDQEYKGIASTDVFSTLFLKMEGRQWPVLEISYLGSDDGERPYGRVETRVTEFPKSLTASDMQTKIGSCLERP